MKSKSKRIKLNEAHTTLAYRDDHPASKCDTNDTTYDNGMSLTDHNDINRYKDVSDCKCTKSTETDAPSQSQATSRCSDGDSDNDTTKMTDNGDLHYNSIYHEILATGALECRAKESDKVKWIRISDDDSPDEFKIFQDRRAVVKKFIIMTVFTGIFNPLLWVYLLSPVSWIYLKRYIRTGKSMAVMVSAVVIVGVLCTAVVVAGCGATDNWVFIPVGLALGLFFLLLPFLVGSVCIFVPNTV